jgi:membrane protein implicated in regulation of membrane protease activity
MIAWYNMIVWLLVGIFFLFIELTCPCFFFVFFAIGAFITAGALCLFDGLTLNGQIGLFLITTISTLIIGRLCFRKTLKGKSETLTSDADDNEYVGRIVIVTERITPEIPGRIELNGSTWSATAKTTIEAGEKVTIVSHKNISFNVKPIH